MSEPKHSPLPWSMGVTYRESVVDAAGNNVVSTGFVPTAMQGLANADLIVRAVNSHADLLAEMRRYLHVIERAEADPEVWEQLTAGLGIATANGYREAIRKATEGQ